MAEERKIEFPRVVMVGPGLIERTPAIAKELSQGTSALIVAGKQTMDIAGSKIKDLLEDSGFSVSVQSSEIANSQTVGEAQSRIKEGKADIAFGVGGGTCIDIAKLSSARENIPFISFPTAATHDGMGSPIASIRDDAGSLKSYPARAPIALIADTKVVATAPHQMLAAGCGDLVANYTAVEDWRLAKKDKGEVFDHYSAALSIMSANMVLDGAHLLSETNEKSAKIVLEGLISSGMAMCITGSSRPASGSEHLFSHALDKLKAGDAFHGGQCGLGAIMMAKLHGLDWEKFKKAMETIGSPTTAKGLGISDEQVVEALVMAPTLRDRYTILHKNPLDRESAELLAKETGVIG